MSELNAGFQSLPPEYQRVISLAQERHDIHVVPLQTLVGGWSGAMVYLVSVTYPASQNIEHYVLKLDRKTARSDEVARHASAQRKSPASFVRDHLAALPFEGVEADSAIAIFYSIAGQSLQSFRPLSHYRQQQQLETIFAATTRVLLEEWNTSAAFEQSVHARDALHKWLGFRLDSGAPIEQFIRQVCQAEPERPGFLIDGQVYPNPLVYARQREPWGSGRSLDLLKGLQHGDLNTNNILIKFAPDEKTLTGYYLIDFALFKDGMPLLYDLRYLEMSYLALALSHVAFPRVSDLILHLATGNTLDLSRAPVETAGVGAVISVARAAFERWVRSQHPSLQDDLWGQYWLAGTAAGLSYCHKAGQADEQRFAGLIYAAANLKRFLTAFSVPLPTDVEHIYSARGSGAPGALPARKLRHNLPVQPTVFIGRTTEIAALRKLIREPGARLITLLGPGGAGKTRLSLQVAQELLKEFSHGVIFVPLADEADPAQFISRLAQQLEVREGGRPLLDNVKDYLRDKQLLLILDNFEQLVAAAPIVGELLADAPQLKVITSSRVALQLHGEHEYPIPPLELPPATLESSPDDLAANESVQLFVARARAVQPNFTLTADNAPAIAEICRRLDGLPLALELAAARVRLLSPQSILTRMEDRLKLLTGGARDLPVRHQALRNTLEWSYSLLQDEGKTLYMRLGIFVGGFRLEDAEAICNPDARLDVLDVLTSLVNNSLVRQDAADAGAPRFNMLETIRAYALERLAASGEMEALQERHARHFGTLVLSETWSRLASAAAFEWLNWLEREHDNVRASLAWCLSASGDIELAAEMIFALEWFWYRRGYFMEGRLWSERILASPSLKETSLERGLVLITSSGMALWQGQPETGLTESLEALALGQRHENELLVTMADLQTAVIHINMGLDRQARPLLIEAQSYFKEQDHAFFFAITNVHLGNVELGMGNVERARALHEEALQVARAVGENWLISFALNNLGEVARTQGQYDLARQHYEEAEALLKETGDKGDMARFVHTLGYIAQHEGDVARAEAQFRKSLEMFRQLGNRRGMAECMAGLAGLRAREGNAEWGAVMLSAAESILKSTGGAWWPADRVEVEANRKLIGAALSEEEWQAAQKKGQAMNLEQALAMASEK